VNASRAERVVTYTVLVAFAIGAIYPVLSILSLALHTKSDLVTGFAWPTDPKLNSFRAAWTEGDFGTGLKNSFIVAAAVTGVSAVLSLGTGYAFGTMRFRGDRWLFGVFLLGIIFTYEATVIPLYYDFQNVPLLHLHLLNTYWALILPQIGQSVALARSGCAPSSAPPLRRSSRPPAWTARRASASSSACSCRRRGPRCSRCARSSSPTPGTSSCSRSCS